MIKVRGKEYLRIIWGPTYDAPENIVRLRQRGSGGYDNLTNEAGASIDF